MYIEFELTCTNLVKEVQEVKHRAEWPETVKPVYNLIVQPQEVDLSF